MKKTDSYKKRWCMVGAAILVLIITVMFCGCDGESSDYAYKAIIKLPTDEVITVDIKNFDSCETYYRIKTTDGIKYRVSVNDCVIIYEEKED